ncbi:Uncharacterized protein OS=Singulisphaera acidiphila (strain ATCC BAA-1392 / DSM 18658 / VKM B-2454 / MOB10) GN=Sinac_5340 PE=4 SV=1: DUF1573 [Gemmata massiliana]|uniref:DUF1573 domain-containing protein n=1 Tax=Gemmata massiliana TaxID=1210884 RepID=A0A6P2D1D4_9BACT|nr:DUF1573 domain-containing protein [Gemmata massiliana]VTR94939.1 Uncharacterized protein OS=Singulisphaera acidiphila (strain ATCC BAA-1392 / DSM 18658 / VKM B-2454 / MOB10) GN=Sinac_5340 PE=4 SV=1: DUF1573 [Gemmata massiliana]
MTRFVMGLVGVLAFNTLTWAGPNDLFTEKDKDFGVSPKGTVLVHYFRFTNTTKETITLGQPRVSCGCVTPALTTNRVAPGETAAVIAYMDTKRIPNAGITKTVLVYVPFTSPTFEEVALKVTTVTRDDLMMSPDTLAFGTVTKGKGAKISTKVTFTSDANWTVNKATSTGGFVSVEAKLNSRSGSIVTYDVTATLDKECPAGNWTSDIYLETSNTAVAKLRIPVTVAVSAAVAASPEIVAFGSVKMGSASEQKVTIQSATPFKILEVKGADEQLSVKVEKDSAKPVHTVVIAANPAAAGGFTRSVEIVTDNKDQPSIIVPVTAKVVSK